MNHWSTQAAVRLVQGLVMFFFRHMVRVHHGESKVVGQKRDVHVVKPGIVPGQSVQLDHGVIGLFHQVLDQRGGNQAATGERVQVILLNHRLVG